MSSVAVADRLAARGGVITAFSERLFAFVERSHARACAALTLLSLACFLPGLVSLQPMDRDEPRFAQASKQMLESGDFIDIRFQDEARYKKPIGIHWLQSAAVAAAEAAGLYEARTTIAAYRMPSLLGAVAMVLLTYWAALGFAGRREAFLAAAFMAASMILTIEAKLAKTDAVLGACSVAAMGALARAYLARGVARLPGGTVLIFWLAFAFGMLVKGPLVPMFSGLCALALSIREGSARWLGALRPGLGAVIVLVVVAPWFIAIVAKSGGAFFSEAVGHDMLGKVGTAQVYHWAPPGFYLLAFFATFWPAAAYTGLAAPAVWIERRDDRIAFALAWILPSWLVFEMVPTKLPHYVMPLYPAIAIVTAMAIAQGFVGPHRRFAKLRMLLLPLIPAGILTALAFAAKTLEGRLPWAGLAIVALSAVIAFAAWWRSARDDIRASVVLSIASAIVFAVGIFDFTMPALQSLRISPRLAAITRGLDCPDPAVATLGYREPSLVFLTPTQLRMLSDAQEAAGFLKSGGCRIAFVESHFEPGLREAAQRAGLKPALVARIAGFNINGGRRIDIGAYVVRP